MNQAFDASIPVLTEIMRDEATPPSAPPLAHPAPVPALVQPAAEAVALPAPDDAFIDA